MFTIESWPDPNIASTPHVRSSSSPDILIDLARTDLDMVVWSRNVPESWIKEMPSLSSAPLVLNTSLRTLTQVLQTYNAQYPAFLIEDLQQTAALIAAFAVSDRLTLTLSPSLPEPDCMTPPKMQAFCCYGNGELSWKSGPESRNPIATSCNLSPFSLALIPSWGWKNTQFSAAPTSGSLYLSLSAT